MIRATSSTCSGRSLLSSVMTSSNDAILQPYARYRRKSTLWRHPDSPLLWELSPRVGAWKTGPKSALGRAGLFTVQVEIRKGTERDIWPASTGTHLPVGVNTGEGHSKDHCSPLIRWVAAVVLRARKRSVVRGPRPWAQLG
jgi:hypothetical protein